MLISQGTQRNDRVDLHLAYWLAAVAGALNASAFHAVGFFSANMTGNVSSLSNELAMGSWKSGLFYLVIVGSFISGATASTLLINAGRRQDKKAVYAYSILIEAFLLLLLGFADLLLAKWLRIPVLVPGLAFLMGVQNAVVTRISDARVRTTHVSGMATDLGIELGIAFDIWRGCIKDIEAPLNQAKLRLHFCTIVAFLTGGILGVLVYRGIGGWLLIVAATILLAIALEEISRARRGHPNNSIEVTSATTSATNSERQPLLQPARTTP